MTGRAKKSSALVLAAGAMLCLLTAMPALPLGRATTRPASAVAEAGGARVQGSVYRLDRNGRPYPAPGVKLRLMHPQLGPSVWVYSGGDGGFAWFGIPPGQFTLEVWLDDRAPAFVVKVAVPANAQVVVVAPIRVG